MSARFDRRLDSIVESVGNTPLVRLRNVGRETPGVKIYVKLEYMNPGGSVKDRPALQMMLDAVADGRLTAQRTLIDSTSGNTGVAYALFCAALGYRLTLVMPANLSQSRKDITRAYGAELIFSDPMEGADGAIQHCRAIVARDPDKYFYPDQYSNPSNPLAHYLGTGREILEQVGGELTHFVTGMGTSGTIMGVTRRLREHTRPIASIAIEPAEPLHGLEGLKHMGSSVVPGVYDPSVPDELLAVSTEDGWDMAARVAAEEGLHVGYSTGANVFGALVIARRLAARGEDGCIVTIGCDRGDRYLATRRLEQFYDW